MNAVVSITLPRLVEKPNDLPRNVLPPCLLVIHDTRRGSQNDIAKLTRRKQLDNPLLHVAQLDVVAGGDDAGFVEAAIELDHDLAAAVVVDFFVLADVTFTQSC